jgi:hypothetical protein
VLLPLAPPRRALAIETKTPLVKLSEEDLLEWASPPNVLCAGGDLYKTFQGTQWAGIANESFYPYTSASGGASACHNGGDPPANRWERQQGWNAGGVFGFSTGANAPTEANMLRALAQQPLSVAINPLHLMSYKGGVYVANASECNADLQHALLLVGWGTDPSTNLTFWRAKNSWGTTCGIAPAVCCQRSFLAVRVC